ncbi:MAG: hypothetical protein AB7V44_33860, partial [Pseudonocardia sp.]
MGAMYRLKAYFGMVPADELGDYVDEVESRYPTQRRGDRWDERSPDRGDRPGYDGYEADDDRADTRVEPRGDARVDDGWERSRTTVRSVASASVRGESARQRTPVTVGVPVQGALAIDRAAERDIDLDERTRTEPEQARTVSPARITTLQPRSYNEARMIGER